MVVENLTGVVTKLIQTQVLNLFLKYLGLPQTNDMRIFGGGAQAAVFLRAPQVIPIFIQGREP